MIAALDLVPVLVLIAGEDSARHSTVRWHAGLSGSLHRMFVHWRSLGCRRMQTDMSGGWRKFLPCMPACVNNVACCATVQCPAQLFAAHSTLAPATGQFLLRSGDAPASAHLGLLWLGWSGLAGWAGSLWSRSGLGRPCYWSGDHLCSAPDRERVEPTQTVPKLVSGLWLFGSG